MSLLNCYILDILKKRYENVEISYFDNIRTNMSKKNIIPSKKNILLFKKNNFRILKRAIKFNNFCDSHQECDYISISPPLRLLFRNYDIITKKGFTKIYNFILRMSPCNNDFLLCNNCTSCVNHLMLLFSNIKNMNDRLSEFSKREISLKFYGNCISIFCWNCRYFTIVRHLIKICPSPININTLFNAVVYCSKFFKNIKTIKFMKEYIEKNNIYELEHYI